MRPAQRNFGGVKLGCAVASALVLAGCSAGDVELNGKLFDAMGVSSATQTKSRDPKVAARAPLVVPPSLQQLPAPNSDPEPAQDLAAINDPDRKVVTDKAELERRQAEYCKVNYEQAKARGDEVAAANAKGPLGSCNPSILTSLKKVLKGGGSDEE